MTSRLSYIYIITDGSGACKIGSAVSPKNRMKELQTGSSAKLSIFDAISVSKERVLLCEFEAHRRLRGNSLIGEWFFISPHAAREVVRSVIADPRNPTLDRDLLDARAADRYARKPKKQSAKGVIFTCPKCRHAGKTRLDPDQIARRTFKCSTCGTSTPGARFLMRIAS